MLLQACSAQSDSLAPDAQGTAELQIDASPLLAANVDHVTVDVAGQTTDLGFNDHTGTFDGTLLVPVGMQTFVAHAFAGQMLVGQSAPTPATIQAGAITRVMIRILDVTSDSPPVYGPILDSLSFPTTATAGAPASFAVSVVAPAGDPITYAWTSDCPDSTFASPTAAATTWTKATAGSCTIQIVASSNGFSVGQSFVIIVFPAGSNAGAASVSAAFIRHPEMQFSLFNFGCVSNSSPGLSASCATTIASPSNAHYLLNVFDWGGSTPGPFAVSVDCGGLIGTDQLSSSIVGGPWVPPLGGGLCFFTGTATNGDGLTATVHMAVLSHAGTALPPADPPDVIGTLSNDRIGCSAAEDMPTECPPFAVGAAIRAGASVNWFDGLVGGVTVTDSCAGPQAIVNASPGFHNTAPWTVSGRPGQACTTTITATNLEGGSLTRTIQYLIASP
jgi:hypothetical protein